MTDIYYETDKDETLHIDEVSQRLLVYLLLHGKTNLDDAVDPLGVEEKSELKRRVQESLGPEAAELVVEESSQATFGDQPPSGTTI